MTAVSPNIVVTDVAASAAQIGDGLALISSAHAAAVDRLTLLFVLRLQRGADVRVHNPVGLDATSQARPDLALLRPRLDFYAAGYPRPTDVLLLIEVTDGTAQQDLARKRRLYAAAGIGEMWTIDLVAGVVEVARDPGPDGYRHVSQATCGDHLSPVAMPEVAFAVADLTG